MGLRCTIVVLFLVLSCGAGFDLDFGDVAEMLKFGQEVVMDILESVHWIQPKQPNENGGENSFPFVKRAEQRVINKIALVSNKIDAFEERSFQRSQALLATILTALPGNIQLEDKLRDLNKLMARMDDYYKRYVAYTKSLESYERYTMEEFADFCVSSSYGAMPDMLKTINHLIISHQLSIRDPGLLKLLTKSFKESSRQICDMQQSPQQLLYSLYNAITLTEIKGYAMMQFSWLLLKTYNKGNFSEEMQLLKKEYMLRTMETLREVKTAMTFAPRALWRCDPSNHEEDVTYTELKQLLQGFVVNEVDMNSAQTCRENCGYYTAEKVYSCYHNQYCSRQRRCNGMLYNCQYVDSDMWVCPSNRDSNRRYEYIEYENGRILGRKGTCANGSTKVDSWWRWLFWHCSYCICFCDDHNSSSDRYFNLRDVTADIENNMVITGIKFTKKNQIIHLQIQQGLLLPRGGIQSETIGWKPVEDYKISDGHVHEGHDYHTLSWSQRALDLDDLEASATTYHGSKNEEHLVTGVRFRLVGKNLNLEVLLTPFNFTTGKLIKPLERSLWHGNDNTAASLTNPRTLLKIEKPDVPTRTRAPSLPDSKSDQYLEFAPSDLDKDVAQTTIPFIDIQPIVVHPAVPISGVGIFHKGREGYGGFVAPKLFTFNFAPHLNIKFPSPTPVLSTNTLGEPEVL